MAPARACSRLARYLLRPPLSLERLRLEPGLVRYYGHYAHVARARRRRSGAQAPDQDEAAFDAPLPGHVPSRAQ